MARRRAPRSSMPEDLPDESVDLTRDFVDEVTWFMREQKISRADLAQSMGVSAGRVSQILSGEENLTLRTLSGVIRALRAQVDFTLHPLDRQERMSGSSARPIGRRAALVGRSA
ncbi:MAG TPA: helix-turn-helix transcriptional regulator [Streptosporangiaceae bacterium]